MSGLLVPPRDASALARGMDALLGDDARARAMGAAAGRRIADHFSLEAMARELERLYRRLLGGERPQAAVSPEPEPLRGEH